MVEDSKQAAAADAQNPAAAKQVIPISEPS